MPSQPERIEHEDESLDTYPESDDLQELYEAVCVERGLGVDQIQRARWVASEVEQYILRNELDAWGTDDE